jgi:hypothetical protein
LISVIISGLLKTKTTMNRALPSESFGEIMFDRLDDLSDARSAREEDEGDWEAQFLEESTVLLTDWLSRTVVPPMLDEVEDKDWCADLAQQVQASAGEELDWDDLVVELLDSLNVVEDREQSWLLHWMWGSDAIKSLYDEVLALQYHPGNCPISDEFRGQIMALIDHSRLIPENDRARFQVVLSHDGPIEVLSLLNRLLMAHAEYAESVQEALLEAHPDIIDQYRERLDDLAAKWA